MLMVPVEKDCWREVLRGIFEVSSQVRAGCRGIFLNAALVVRLNIMKCCHIGEGEQVGDNKYPKEQISSDAWLSFRGRTYSVANINVTIGCMGRSTILKCFGYLEIEHS